MLRYILLFHFYITLLLSNDWGDGIWITTAPLSAVQISGSRRVVTVLFLGFLQMEANNEHTAADNTNSPTKKAWKHMYTSKHSAVFY